jgi:hypothetical protein
MVTYRFDAMPGALHVAIPHTYDDTLFKTRSAEARAVVTRREHPAPHATPALSPSSIAARHHSLKQIGALLDEGRNIRVTGVGPNPDRKGTSIIAGGTSEKYAGESKPVAIRIDHKTTLFRSSGEALPPAFATELAEGGVIVVEGSRSKRGVIRAKRIVVV